MWSEEYKDCLAYIDAFWDQVIHRPTRKKVSRKILTIPYPFIVPNQSKFNTIYYWDTYFMFRGILGTKRDWLMKSMINNFTYLFNKYDIIPNSNLAGFTNRSQPPFLTSMILDVYRTPHTRHTFRESLQKVFAPIQKIKERRWLQQAFETAKKEYFLVWLDTEDSYNHHVDGYGLARYGDRDIGYDHSSELESGWDFTSRFYNRCNEFLPIDLNVYLYKYERDFALFASLFSDTQYEVETWQSTATSRKNEINKHMWNEEEGFFYDYGYNYKKIGNFLSLAGFTPLWARLATLEQARKMVKKLPKFETPYGLAITAKESLAPDMDLSQIPRRYHPAILDIITPKQWDYPNIWAPLEYLTVIGLLNYGFVDDATRIMEKSVKAHAAVFRKYGTFFEKLNGETGDGGRGAQYPDQQGFGWTNAVFYRYVHILDTLKSGVSIYISQTGEPPYELSILH